MKKNVFLLVVIIAIAVTSCTKTTNTQYSYVRVISAIPTDTLNVFANNELWIGGVNLSGFTSYFKAPVGKTTFKVYSTKDATTVIKTNNSTLAANGFYTYILADSIQRVQPSFLTDNISMPAAGRAKIRFLNLACNKTEAVDVAVGAIDIATNRIFNDQSTDVSAAQYAEVEVLISQTLSYNINLRKTGTNVILATLDYPLVSRGVYTIVAFPTNKLSSGYALRVQQDN